MEEREKELRDLIVKEACAWKGTKYHHRPIGTAKKAAELKGVVADCLTYMIGVFYNTGFIDDFPIPFYPHDFMMHSKKRDIEGGEAEETYLEGVLSFGTEVSEPLPGDVVLYKFADSQIFAHGGIVLEWPMWIMHCYRHGVLQARGMQGGYIGVQRKFISVFPLKQPRVVR